MTMKIKFLLYSFLITLGGSYVSGSSADTGRVLLEPVIKYSFCTISQSSGTIGIVGDKWALKQWFNVKDFKGKIVVQGSRFYQGSDMYKYIGRSAGPRRPPLPSTEEYSMVELPEEIVNNIEIFRGGRGKIEIVVNDFSVGGKIYRVSEKINLVCRGPLP